MIAIFASWLQFSQKYVCPHLLMGVVAACFGMPIYQSQFLTQSEQQQWTDLHLLEKVDHIQNVITQHQTMKSQVAFLPDYWQKYAIKLAIRHLMTELSAVTHLSHRGLARLTLRQLALLHALPCQHNWLLIIPHGYLPTATALAANYPHSFSEALWLAAKMGIRAGPVSG